MPNGEPLGIFDAVNRDVDRIQRALPGPLLPLPAPIGEKAPTAEPRTPVELVQNIPVQTRRATSAIREGQTITVDGDAGLVDLLV